MLPTEGREYLEGLEVRGGEGSGRVTGGVARGVGR